MCAYIKKGFGRKYVKLMTEINMVVGMRYWGKSKSRLFLLYNPVLHRLRVTISLPQKRKCKKARLYKTYLGGERFSQDGWKVNWLDPDNSATSYLSSSYI